MQQPDQFGKFRRHRARHQPRSRLDHGDTATSLDRTGCHLEADQSTADDDDIRTGQQLPGQAAGVDGGPQRKDAFQLPSGDVQQSRFRTGCQ